MTANLPDILRAVAEGRPVDRSALAAQLGDPELTAAVTELTERVEDLRRRGAELRALMSSTRDLLAEPDTDRLLQRVVDRAFGLMDVDVAYLSVADPERDELVVRAVTGTVSPRFPGMVVPSGVGLASLAMRTRHPQWVEDYSSFLTIPHDPIIDSITQEEQLRSMLGVPLVAEGEALGVLFAASRRPHAFRPDEVALLSAFAGQAAVVLRLGRLLREATDATAEAAKRHHQAEWAASVHVELTRLVVEGHDADRVVGALASALGRTVLYADPTQPYDAATQALLEKTPVADAVAEAARQGRAIRLPADGGEVELVAPVVAAHGGTGALLVLRSDVALSEVERRTVERSALTAALVTLRRTAMDEAQERVRGELADDLLEDLGRRRDALRRAQTRGYAVDEPWNVLAIVCADETRPLVLRVLRARDELLATAGHGGVTVLAPARLPVEDVVRRLRGGERDLIRLVMVAACGDLDEAASAAAATWNAACLAEGLGVTAGVVDATAFAPYSALFGGDGARMAAFVSSTLGAVFTWDRDHGSALFDTLSALFDERWSLSATARVLHVHLNTVKQRAQRLHDILGDDLDRPEMRFRIESAVRIERARRIVEGT